MDQKQLVTEIADYLRDSGFGPRGYTERIGVPDQILLSPLAFRNQDVPHALRIIFRLRRQGLRMPDTYSLALAVAGSIVVNGHDPYPLPKRLREFLAKGPPPASRGRIPDYETHRNEYIRS